MPAARSVERTHSGFKRLDEPARQRSDCCSSGTSSCLSEALAGAGRRAEAVGGPVVGRPRWPRILSITGLSSMKAMTLRRPPQGQARMSSRKTRRSSSLQGMRESSGRKGLVAGGGWEGVRRVARTWCVCGARTRRGRWHDLLSPLRGRPEDAVVAHEVSPRRRDQRRETAEQFAQSEEGRAKHLNRHLGQKLATALTVKDVDESRTRRLAERTRRKRRPRRPRSTRKLSCSSACSTTRSRAAHSRPIRSER